MTDGSTLVLGFLLGLSIILGVTCGKAERMESEKLCRHTIQRSFGKTSEEAKALMDETREWESK